MRPHNGILAFIYVFLLLLFFLEGMFFFVLPFSISLQDGLLYAFRHVPWFLPYVGAFVCLLSITLLVVSWKLHAKRYLRLTMECDEITIEKRVIEAYVSRFFSNRDAVQDIILGKDGSLEVVLGNASLPEKESDPMLTTLQNELGAELAVKLGYKQPFTVTIVSS